MVSPFPPTTLRGRLTQALRRLTLVSFATCIVGGACASQPALAAFSAPGGTLCRLAVESAHQQRGLLVFSRTAGFRHSSIPDGIDCMRILATEFARPILCTEDSSEFRDEVLDRYAVVVFLNTTGDVLDEVQQAAFERFIGRGGAFLGIHAAADTEYGWPFYRECVGALFKSHPAIQEARIDVLDRMHPSTRHLPPVWTRRDEWYDFRATPGPAFRRLLRLDVGSVRGERMVEDGLAEQHPIAWCREFGLARCLYTGGGHTEESYTEDGFVQHLRGALFWLMSPRPGARY